MTQWKRAQPSVLELLSTTTYSVKVAMKAEALAFNPFFIVLHSEASLFKLEAVSEKPEVAGSFR